ncbi:hypothetical protein JCM8097_000997 [Rhodosporidiobolus ruineniae]
MEQPRPAQCRLIQTHCFALDRLTSLPPEILQSIFLQLTDAPPPPLCRSLLPYTRSARFRHVEIISFRQLDAFARTLKAVPGVGAYSRSFGISLLDGTEAVLAKENPSLRELLLETFARLPSVKEVQVDWMSAAVLLSEEGTSGGLLRSMRVLRIAVLLAQLNSTDFITYRLALVSRFPSLRQLEVMSLPYDTNSNAATAFDLFPATTDDAHALDMAPIPNVSTLILGGALCDRRVVNLIRAFSNLVEVTMYDSFASPHITPAIHALAPTSVRKLRLQRLIATPPPVSLPMPGPPVDWTRLSALEELVLGMPLATDDLPAQLAQLPSLQRLCFGATSNPTFAQLRELLVPSTSRPPALEAIVLSSQTGQVGAPISAATLPSIQLWLAALRTAQADAAANPEEPAITPIFPLLDWHLPQWTPEFGAADAEALFPLARAAGIHLSGTVVSACLTTYVLERQLDIWTTGAASELSAEEREALEKRELWDALALRYKARLLGEEAVVVAPEGGEGEADAKMELA